MLASLLVILKWLAIVAAVLALATWLFIRFHPVFGGEPDARSLARIQASPQFDGQVFRNAEPTPLMSPGNTQPVGVIEWLRNVLTPPEGKVPSELLPNRPLNLHEKPLKDGQFVWLGHSTVLFRLAGKVMSLTRCSTGPRPSRWQGRLSRCGILSPPPTSLHWTSCCCHMTTMTTWTGVPSAIWIRG